MNEEECKRCWTHSTPQKPCVGIRYPSFCTNGSGNPIKSQKGVGTTVLATFGLNHPDRQPLGDIAGTFITIIIKNPAIRLFYTHRFDEESFEISTDEIKEQINGVEITHPAALSATKEMVVEGIRETGSLQCPLME